MAEDSPFLSVEYSLCILTFERSHSSLRCTCLFTLLLCSLKVRLIQISGYTFFPVSEAATTVVRRNNLKTRSLRPLNTDCVFFIRSDGCLLCVYRSDYELRLQKRSFSKYSYFFYRAKAVLLQDNETDCL